MFAFSYFPFFPFRPAFGGFDPSQGFPFPCWEEVCFTGNIGTRRCRLAVCACVFAAFQGSYKRVRKRLAHSDRSGSAQPDSESRNCSVIFESTPDRRAHAAERTAPRPATTTTTTSGKCGVRVVHFPTIPSSNTLFILLFCLFDCSVFGVFPVVGCRRLNFPSAVYFRARARSNPPFKTTTALKQLLSSDNAARQSVRIVLSFIRFRNREHQLRDFATFDQTVTIHTCALILIRFFFSQIVPRGSFSCVVFVAYFLLRERMCTRVLPAGLFV